MGVFSDIMTVLGNKDKLTDNLKNAGDNLLKSNNNNNSLSKRASEGILQFPVIVSSALDIETSQTITKALERQFSTFAEVAFSMSPTLTYKQNVNATDYLKRFHQNQPNMFDLVFKEGYDLLETDDYVILGGTYESTTNSINAANREQLVNLIEFARMDILNNKFKPRVEFMYNFSDNELNKKHNAIVSEADAGDMRKQTLQQKYQTVDYWRNTLQDNDVKKSNELVSTVLHLKIKLVNDDNEQVGIMDFLVGIKGVMHPVKSEEMITNMVDACRNNDNIFNFLRWTTGEISFFKDFFLNINEIKKDVFDKSRGASPWWIALKRRKSASGITNYLNKFKANSSSNTILPNTTIVISAEEVGFIKSEFGYDLFNRIFVNKIMEKYFLLGFVIVDNATQIAHFIFDGDPDFQSVTFSALERSGSNDERKFKEMLKTLNRM